MIDLDAIRARARPAIDVANVESHIGLHHTRDLRDLLGECERLRAENARASDVVFADAVSRDTAETELDAAWALVAKLAQSARKLGHGAGSRVCDACGAVREAEAALEARR